MAAAQSANAVPTANSAHHPRSARRGPLGLLVLGLWAAVMLSMPFYVFPSGRPQISDYLLAAVSIIALLLVGRHDRLFNPPTRALTAFVGYVAVINLAWALALGSADLVITTFFYVFNLLVVTSALRLFTHHRKKFLDVTYYTISFSVVLQAVFGFAIGGTSRGWIYFNSANQLSYYSLAATTICVVLSQHRRGSRLYLGLVLVAGLYMQYISVSRAGAVAMIALLGALVVRRPAAMLAGVAILAGALLLVDAKSERANIWEIRINVTEGETLSDHIQERGVTRMVDNPGHLVFGAGEGAYERFSPLGLELHSSFLTVMFCYGLPGTLLFGMVLWRVWRITGRRIGIFLVPVFLFGVTHQGLRFRSFWLTLVICMVVAMMPAGAEQRRQSIGRRSAG